MKASNEILFTPSQIGTLKIRNKLMVAPMTRVSAQEDGTVGVLMQEYYQGFAQGGFGLVVTEGLYTDQLYSQCYYKQPGISTQNQADSWKPIIDVVHANGTAIVAQLMHAGALSQHNRFTEKSMAPSAVRPLGEQMPFYYGNGAYQTPEAMTQKDIKDVIQGFVSSALFAKSVGFDGVEIHGANGYLLDQFLTVYSNQREDAYGGKLDNRLRIYKEIINAVREAVGNDFIVGIRFSQKKVNDAEYLWPEEELAAKHIFSQMKECNVDYIHTTEPVLNHPAFNGSASLSSLAKQFSGLPVIANGGVNEPLLAADMLANGQADFIALGKIALSNQDWPNRVKHAEAISDFDFSMFSPIADLQTAQCYFEKMDPAHQDKSLEN